MYVCMYVCMYVVVSLILCLSLIAWIHRAHPLRGEGSGCHCGSTSVGRSEHRLHRYGNWYPRKGRTVDFNLYLNISCLNINLRCIHTWVGFVKYLSIAHSHTFPLHAILFLLTMAVLCSSRRVSEKTPLRGGCVLRFQLYARTYYCMSYVCGSIPALWHSVSLIVWKTSVSERSCVF